MRIKIKALLEILAILALFLYFSYIIQKNIEFFQGLVTNNFIGVLFYIFIGVVSVVVAPVTTLPLIVVASKLWGWFFAGFISVLAWAIGAWIAFALSRKYGVKLIRRFISLDKIHKIEKRIPQENVFLGIVFLIKC